jgi:hypothetical protein
MPDPANQPSASRAPSGPSFEWVRARWGAALVCRPLLVHAPHVFAGRDLGATARGGSGDDIWGAVAEHLGASRDRVVRLTQVHGADAVVIGPYDAVPAQPPRADAILTARSDVAVLVQAADCVPLLLADPEAGAVAAVHAGWRGTLAGAAGRAVAALVSACDARPARMVAAIGPCIGPCCYRVGSEIRARYEAGAFRAVDLDRWFVGADGDLRLDLWGATRDQLLAAGLDAERVHLSAICTAENTDRVPSYRAEGPGAGRLIAAIRPAPATDRRTS